MMDGCTLTDFKTETTIHSHYKAWKIQDILELRLYCGQRFIIYTTYNKQQLKKKTSEIFSAHWAFEGFFISNFEMNTKTINCKLFSGPLI